MHAHPEQASAPPLSAEDDAAAATLQKWEREQAEIRARYPTIGEAGSAANVSFVRMFRILGGRMVDPLALADLLMIYPPKEDCVSAT